ncbi:MAG TPA: hypothetical protein VEB19_09850 [Gemmatimonadaceae bacterium]|nr:hypothetical protein [Gemmatimonadaceae bacterium]
MTAWIIAALVGTAAAALSYLRLRAPSAPWRVLLGALRAAALAILVALLLDAPLGRPRVAAPGVFVDASLSMTREGAQLARIAWDSVRGAGGDSTWVFGDSVRDGEEASPVVDGNSRVRPVVERTMASGRPAVVITDGELQDSSALDGLVSGSRVIVLARPARPDAALVSMDAPRAAVDGDSLAIRITVAAGAQGAQAGTVTLLMDAQQLGRWPLEAMSAWSERQLDVRVRAAGVQGAAVLRAAVSSPGDAEARNDTLAAIIELSRAASAVFVSTSPDQDARFAIAVLRGTLALPTRGFLRVAPGMWRNEGSLTGTTEADVRQALRDAPVAILHGDTAIFGPPRGATLGPLALIVPAEADEGEWYVAATPVSPLSGALAAIPIDSLPPIAAGTPATGAWTAVETRRGRDPVRRPVVVGQDEPRRVVTVTGSGFWRWRFRAGASADAYAALWGGIFDWLAAERADRRSAVPDLNSVRAGQLIRWRRGSSADSVVRVVIQPRAVSPGKTDTLTLRFTSGSAVHETGALPQGIYDVIVPGGRTMLAVNASSELLPTRPRLRSGSVGSRVQVDDARRARNRGALYVLVVLLLCAEWVARRRLGLR